MAEKIITSQAHTSPYKFNGKELDEGTGMYYYGARYYDPRISVLVNVDPSLQDLIIGHHIVMHLIIQYDTLILIEWDQVIE